jgi:hypothetical protein
MRIQCGWPFHHPSNQGPSNSGIGSVTFNPLRFVKLLRRSAAIRNHKYETAVAAIQHSVLPAQDQTRNEDAAVSRINKRL